MKEVVGRTDFKITIMYSINQTTFIGYRDETVKICE